MAHQWQSMECNLGRIDADLFLAYLDDRGSCLCTLPSAACHRQTSVDQLLFNDLPPANFFVLVDGGSSVIVHSHVGQVDVDLLQLLGVRKLRGFGFNLERVVEVGHGGRG